MFGKKKKEAEERHKKELGELEAKLERMKVEHGKELSELSDEKDDEKKADIEKELTKATETVSALMKQVKSMGEKLNVLDSVPELIQKELEEKGIDKVDIEKIKGELLKDSQQKSEEQSVQEEAAGAEFENAYDKALENINAE